MTDILFIFEADSSKLNLAQGFSMTNLPKLLGTGTLYAFDVSIG
jgi:hypothetical protein